MDSLEECRAFVGERESGWPLVGCNLDLVYI